MTQVPNINISTLSKMDANPANSSENNSYIPNLPIDVINYLFTLLINSRDFSSFARTSKFFSSISHQISKDAFTSDSMHKFLSGRNLFSDENFFEKAVELVQATLKRPLNKNECRQIMAPSSSMGENNQTIANLELEFYKVLKARCIELGITLESFEYPMHVNAAFNGLRNMARSMCHKRDIIPTRLKMGTLCNNIELKIYNEIVDTYVHQPPESITKESFSQIIDKLNILFPGNSKSEIESSLKDSLTERHGRSFRELAKKLSSPNPTTSDMLEVQIQLQSLSETKEQSSHKLIDAQSAKKTAESQLKKALMEGHGLINPLYFLHAFDSEDAAVTIARTNYLSKCADYDIAEKEHKDLVARLSDLIEVQRALKQKLKESADFYRDLQEY